MAFMQVTSSKLSLFNFTSDSYSIYGGILFCLLNFGDTRLRHQFFGFLRYRSFGS